MTYLSWFSGIGGFDLALNRAGFRCVGACELDPLARRIYERRIGAPPWFPNDVTKVLAEDVPHADVWVGGPPCQAFSVAGKREALNDHRGDLSRVWFRLAREVRPRWLVMENVPGLLTVWGGAVFGGILAELGQCGYRWAYRVLDAQHFGVAQRRRRIFLVAHLGDGADPAAVLFEREGVRRATSARSEARQDVAGTTGADTSGNGTPDGPDRMTFNTAYQAHGTNLGPMGTLRAGNGHTTGGVPFVAATVRASDGHHGFSSPRGDGCDNLVPAVADPITTNEGKTYSHEGSHNFRLHNVVPYALRGGSPRGKADARMVDVLGTLDTRGSKPQTNSAATVVAFDPTQVTSSENRSRCLPGEPSPTLARTARPPHVGSQQLGVRRLTPAECEALQGLPLGWTCLCGVEPYTTVSCRCPDSPRHRVVGNGVAVPCVEWIARRLVAEMNRAPG